MYSSCSKNIRNAEVLLTKAKPNKEKAKISHRPILKLILSASVSSLPKALDTFVITASEKPVRVIYIKKRHVCPRVKAANSLVPYQPIIATSVSPKPNCAICAIINGRESLKVDSRCSLNCVSQLYYKID